MEYNILTFCCRTVFISNELEIPTSWGDDIFKIHIEVDNVPSNTLADMWNELSLPAEITKLCI